MQKRGIDLAKYNYIAVEGPIGVGKTILVDKLVRRFDAEKIETPVADNQFIEKFYRDPIHYAFPAQIFFLLSRYRLLLSLFELDLFHQTVVSDFVFERDNFFASLFLNESELRLYHQVENHLRKDVPHPDLVIFLQAPIEMIVRNISRKGRQFERKLITEEFISILAKEYTKFFFDWTKTPLLVVDMASVDFDKADDLDNLIDYINSASITGQQYYSVSTWL